MEAIVQAYEITITSWSGLRKIVAANSSSHARSGDWREANDAGYKIPYTDFRAKRAKKFDTLAASQTGRGPITIGWEDKNERESWGCLATAA